ncbi:MAG: hypothetical protein CMA70_04885 [Euryarchaeota archaeon]|nr:hypothetical protein [Euryarchaeota archaeon]
MARAIHQLFIILDLHNWIILQPISFWYSIIEREIMSKEVKTERTPWVELPRLRTAEETWYKRRVYNTGPCCAEGCGKPATHSNKAMYEYGFKIKEEIHWDGTHYCNRMCLPKHMLQRYNYQYRKHKNPSHGEVRLEIHAKSMERCEEFASRLEANNFLRGTISLIAKEEGLSRQRVYQLLEKVYGPGSVPVQNLPAAAAESPAKQA